MRTVLFTMFMIAAGCSGGNATDDSDELDAPVGKADAASQPSGVYTNSVQAVGEIESLTLNEDHTFTRTTLVECAVLPPSDRGACNPLMQSGTYLFTHSSTKHYIRFYAADGSDLDRYQWKLTSGALQLELDGDDRWFSLAKGGTCESAGGSCVALSPGSCSAGSIGDATEYSCGSGLGKECCLPKQAENSCNSASDCSGLLPDFCRVCSGGTSVCAHWECVENACQTVTCD